MAEPGVLADGQGDDIGPTGQVRGPDPFSAGSFFDGFPGAVLLVGPNGLVLTSNELGAPIAKLLRGEGQSNLRQAIAAALDGKMAQVAPFIVEDGPEDGVVERAYDLVVLPWGDGAAALLLGRDITLERSLRAALIDSRQRFKDLIEIAADFAWESDPDGRFTYISRDSVLGYPAAGLIGRRPQDALPNIDEVAAALFLPRDDHIEGELWTQNQQGDSVCLSVGSLPLFDDTGAWLGARGICRDVTESRGREERLVGAHNQDRMLSYVLQLVRNELEPVRMMAAATETLVPATAADGVVFYHRGESGEYFVQGQSGETLPEGLAEVARRAMQDSKDRVCHEGEEGRLLGQVTRHQNERNGFLVLWRRPQGRPWGDEANALLGQVAEQLGFVNQQLIRENELERLSATDPLTGLLNRRAFGESLERRLARQVNRKPGGALFYLDLDNFKQVNDVCGHDVGDDVLKSVARLLQEHIRSADLAARLGGDEFALYLGSISREAAEQKGRMILAKAHSLQKFSANSDQPLGLSIGIALLDSASHESLDALLKRADSAMYQAKRDGKGTLAFAPPPGNVATKDRRAATPASKE